MNRLVSRLLTLSLACAPALLGGCVVVKEAYKPNPQPAAYTPPVPPELDRAWQPQPMSEGSLYAAATPNLFGDDRASRPGDIIQVRVMQRNKGTKSANTETARKSGISARIKYFLGLEDDINKVTGYLDNNTPEPKPGTEGWDPVDLLSAESTTTFSGEGGTERNDNLEATVSAIVTDVMQNGNLVIYGHQTVTLNNEASVLTVQGIVRPSDLDVDNSILSSRIANARIEFTGSGVITDKQHPGWANRIFSWVWPF